VKIEVGMLVMIVDSADFINPFARVYIGHIGTVIGTWRSKRTPNKIGCDISGTDTSRVAFCEEQLKPIPPPEAAEEDFQEDLKLWLNKEVTA